ncbi:roadblock/LC7 domain-containing protein [Persicimonas caeni]|uniref:Roadblock/LC7 domain-containing protein n=1 Tax=Persicimonas caeni TaxID=2292766 RepID=A0A4Y6Q1Q8_PERCE|nr:roadblock/LC7 domain-containing protein [Persicimonas caeni]QDG53935.1 roadblock/LC7 domain-containing protein [Persicimonas caeni]QED35156.1 roadblock/LC7 domain-containing protein [Persicimonas caeni]
MSASPRATTRSPASPILEEALHRTPDIEGMVLLQAKGEVLAVAGAHTDKRRQLASFAVGVFELSTRLATESGRGDVEFHLMRTDDGHMAIHQVGEDRFLFSLAAAEAPLGLVTHDLGWCADRLSRTR